MDWEKSREVSGEWSHCLLEPQCPGLSWGLYRFPDFPSSALAQTLALMTLCQPPGHRPPLTGERVSNLAELPFNQYRECISVQTDKGTEVATNLVIVCNGIKINSFAYHSAFGK